ncbi:MAG: LD-carboxypeptidase [Sporichthyaceae bacterium]|nr:LD-carboxypeptidase [Sporichthyaceae bacterium]
MTARVPLDALGTAGALTPLTRPRRLRAGDRVAVVAPSGHIEPDRLRRGVARLESWELEVTVGRHVLARTRHHAGSDEQRLADVQEAWCDPAVVGVFCARGGSGAAQLVDRLDWAAMGDGGPKVLVGFSDITVLHEAVAHHLGLVSLFGPMPAAAALAGPDPDQATAEHLRRTLFEPDSVQVLGDPATVCHVAGVARGVTVGGTLALLANTVGTAESRRASGGIAVLEDIAEPAYRIDSMLTQLLRTGWFDGVAGVVLGSWVGCGDGAVDTVAERLAPLGVPLVSGLPFGHGVPQLTVPLGVEAELDAAQGTLTMLRPALS